MASNYYQSLTLGAYLKLLRNMSSPNYPNQMIWFSSIFRSYQKDRSKLEGRDYQISQSQLSDILNDKNHIPAPFIQFYTSNSTGRSMLHNDLAQYFADVAPTPGRRKAYLEQLSALLEKPSNIHPLDKAFILDTVNKQTLDEQLPEFCCRLLLVLIYVSSRR